MPDRERKPPERPSDQSDPHAQRAGRSDRPTHPLRTALLVATATVLVAAGVTAWRLWPRYSTFYTDGADIHADVSAATPRDILWEPPRPLGEIINTSDHDYEPRLSWDGMTLFFVRGKAAHNADIYLARRTPSGWTAPEPLAEINTEHDELGPEPSGDGSALFFYSDRPGGSGGYDLWVAYRRGDGTSGYREPINLGPGVNSEFNDYGPAVTRDGALLYFSSNRPRDEVEAPDPHAWPATVREDLFRRTYDLYESAITDSGFGPAVALDALNTPANEGAPAVSPTGDFLYFASDRDGGHGGFDLYRVRRAAAGFHPTENLGPAVNTSSNELDPGLTHLGYGLFFSSDRFAPAAGPPSEAVTIERQYDLYYTTSREVYRDRLRESYPIDWAALWSAIGPNLLWALLALLAVLLLLRLLRDLKGRRLSTLAKCLIASIVAHLLLLILFHAWEVTAGIAHALGGRRAIRVAMISPAQGDEITAQVRGALSGGVVAAPAMPARDQPAPVFSTPPAEAQPFDVAPESELVFTDRAPSASPRQVADAQPIEQPASLPPQVFREEAHELPDDIALPAPPVAAPAQQEEQALRVDPAQPAHARRPAPAALSTDPPQPPSPITDAPIPPMPAELHEARSVSGGAAPRLADATPTADSAPPVIDPTRMDDHGLTELVLPALRVPGQSDAPLDAKSQRTDSTNGDADEPRSVAELAPVPIGLPPPRAELTRNMVAEEHVNDSDRDEARTFESDLPPTEDAWQEIAKASRAAEDSATPDAPRDSRPFADATLQDLAPTPPPTSQAREASLRAAREALSHLLDPAAQPVRLPEATPSVAEAHAPMAAQADATDRSSPTPEAWAPFATASSVRAPLEQAPPARPEDPRRPIDASLPPSEWDEAPVSIATDRAFADARDRTERSTSPFPLLPADAEWSPGEPIPLRLPRETMGEADPFELRDPERRAAILEAMGGGEETERAVADALAWLARHQSDDGRWASRNFDDGCGNCGGEAAIDADVAVTGLALMCFLGAGHDHATPGPYQPAVARGLEWLQAQQTDTGSLMGGETLYSHGIATIALAEAYGMSRDEKLVRAVQRAVTFIADARNDRAGGWRYEPGQPGDTSVLGWQVMAMRSAQMAGLYVPPDAVDAARSWMQGVSSGEAGGLYAYMPSRRPTPSMTAEGMFVQQLLGVDRDDARMAESAALLLENLPEADARPNTYYWYYGTLAAFHHQGELWARWNPAMRGAVLPQQRRGGPPDGSWDPTGDEWGQEAGRVYQTAMCTLMLEVYYRYLPLFLLEPPAETSRVIRGVVRDAATDEHLAGAEVRVELSDGATVRSTTDAAGRYTLAVPESPPHFAVTAEHAGHVPDAANVASASLGTGPLRLDFALRPQEAGILALEPSPAVHHLGNDRFEGRINSQFQLPSEGRRLSITFTVEAGHLNPRPRRARLEFLARGVQCPHEVWINDDQLPGLDEESPSDGSFGPRVIAFDPELLQAGENRLRIVAIQCRGDLDDFEFVNPQIRFAE
jgi:hypothetical protein